MQEKTKLLYISNDRGLIENIQEILDLNYPEQYQVDYLPNLASFLNVLDSLNSYSTIIATPQLTRGILTEANLSSLEINRIKLFDDASFEDSLELETKVEGGRRYSDIANGLLVSLLAKRNYFRGGIMIHPYYENVHEAYKSSALMRNIQDVTKENRLKPDEIAYLKMGVKSDVMLESILKLVSKDYVDRRIGPGDPGFIFGQHPN